MAKKKKSKSKKKVYQTPLGLVMIIVAAIAVIAVGDYYRTFLKDNVNEEMPGKGVVEISKSCTYEDMCEILLQSGILRKPHSFLMAAKFYKLKDTFKPGCYKFSRGMDNKAIVRTLACGWQEPVRLTFNSHVRTLENLAGVFGRALEADSAAFIKALTNPSTIKSLGFKPETFPAMFIPNTYEVYWTITPDNLVARMYREWEDFWTDARTQKARAIGLSKTEVSTLASIVVEETRFRDEMPTVAGVYINRLRKGIPLQADPTIKYAIREEGVTRILNRHLKVDSPYNTYKYKGLPPGPITIPSIDAIDAVLNYEHHSYVYFCARPTFDGRHSFASTYNQHLENAHAYHVAYKEWEAERAAAQAAAAQAAADSLSALNL